MNKKNNSRPKIRTAQKLSGFCQSPDVRALCFLFLLLSASCSFMFRDYLYGNNLMIFNDIGSDSWQQYIMNYTSIVNHLRDGSFYAGEKGGESRREGDTGRGAVFWNGSGGHMDVKIVVLKLRRFLGVHMFH